MNHKKSYFGHVDKENSRTDIVQELVLQVGFKNESKPFRELFEEVRNDNECQGQDCDRPRHFRSSSFEIFQKLSTRKKNEEPIAYSYGRMCTWSIQRTAAYNSPKMILGVDFAGKCVLTCDCAALTKWHML